MEQLRKDLRNYAEGNPALNEEMESHMTKLTLICQNPVVQAAFNCAVEHVYPFIETGDENLWKHIVIEDFIEYFRYWFTDLPNPNGGLMAMFSFPCFYMYNPPAIYFLNKMTSQCEGAKRHTREIFDWTVEFIKIRGRYMDSPESLQNVKNWLSDQNIGMKDFVVPEGGFKSFNEFFTRELNMERNPRPIACPLDDSIVVAPADIIVNHIQSKLVLHSTLDVKGRHISVCDLLGGSALAKAFIGGTAISGVLMPNVYHHYHSPVSGEIVEAGEREGLYYGESWFEDFSNPGQGDTDFSIFEDFHRAYYIIRTEEFGLVGLVAVGLMTVSRIMPSLVGDRSTYVEPGATPVKVAKGARLGHFSYGGSLNILLFEKDVMSCVSVLMGNRIGKMQRKVATGSDVQNGFH